MPHNDDDRLRGAAVEKTDSQENMMPTASVAPDLDEQWDAAMLKFAEADATFEVFLPPGVRRQAQRRARRKKVDRPGTDPTPPRPRRAPRRDMLRAAKEDPDGYAAYLDRAWLCIDEQLWMAEARREARRRRWADGGAPGVGERRPRLINLGGATA